MFGSWRWREDSGQHQGEVRDERRQMVAAKIQGRFCTDLSCHICQVACQRLCILGHAQHFVRTSLVDSMGHHVDGNCREAYFLKHGSHSEPHPRCFTTSMDEHVCPDFEIYNLTICRLHLQTSEIVVSPSCENEMVEIAQEKWSFLSNHALLVKLVRSRLKKLRWYSELSVRRFLWTSVRNTKGHL